MKNVYSKIDNEKKIKLNKFSQLSTFFVGYETKIYNDENLFIALIEWNDTPKTFVCCIILSSIL